jgi:hypothetical protein
VLAAAYAETGQFGDAVFTAERALRLAGEYQSEDLPAKIEQELELYRRQNPLRR